MVVTADEVIAVPAESVDRVLDTTGAGDLFAAGFLHGLTSGATLAECARLGSIAAAEVISPRRSSPAGGAAYAGVVTSLRSPAVPTAAFRQRH